MMTRVLIVTSKWNSATFGADGGSMTALNVAEALEGKAECDILIPEELSPSLSPRQFKRIHTYRSESYGEGGNKFQNRCNQARTVAEIVGKLIADYDRIVVLHVFNAFFLSDTIQSGEFKKIILFPMFLSSSYTMCGENVPDWYIEYERNVLSRVSSIITPSEFERKQLEEDFNVSKECIKVIPRTVGINFRHIRDYRVSRGVIKLACVASFRKQKRLRLAVALTNELKKRSAVVRISLVGSIQDKGEYIIFKEALRDGWISKEIMHTEYMRPSGINALYSETDFNVSFSQCETFGRSIIESLCTGLPNILLDETGHLQSLIGPGHGAIFCNTVEEMSERIIEYAANETKYRMLTQQARAYGEKFRTNRLEPLLSNAILEDPHDRQ